jgi:hypothetical protein
MTESLAAVACEALANLLVRFSNLECCQVSSANGGIFRLECS